MLLAKMNLKVGRDFEAGSSISLMSLFNSHERFKTFQLQADVLEDQLVQLHLGSVGRLDVPVGNDMKAGQKKTLMTLFWYPARTQSIIALTGLMAGDSLPVEIHINNQGDCDHV